MFSLLRQRNFSLLWFGGLISYIGDWVLFTALPVFVFTITGSVLATGLMFATTMVPSVLLGSVAGVAAFRLLSGVEIAKEQAQSPLARLPELAGNTSVD